MRIEEQILLEAAKMYAYKTGNVSEKKTLPDNVDWNKVYQLAYQNKCITMVYRYLKMKDINADLYSKLEKEYLKRKRQKELFWEMLHEVIPVLNKKGYRWCYQKGFLIGKFLYNDLYVRDFGDIDLIFEEKDLLDVKSLLIDKFGFRQVNKGIPQEEELPSTGVFHEYWLLKTVENINIEIEVKESTSAINKQYIKETLI